MKILISTTGSSTPIELVNGLPDLSAYPEPTKSILQNAFDNGYFVELEGSNITAPPNWESLLLHLANGDLYALFERNREVAESSTSVALYRGDIVSAITTIKREEFLASGLGLLQQRAGYEFTEQEIADWNRVTEELGFSELVRI